MQRERDRRSRSGGRPRTQSYHGEMITGVKKPKLRDAIEKKTSVEELSKAIESKSELPRVVVATPPSTEVPTSSAESADGKPARKVAKKYSFDEMLARLLKAQGSHAISEAVEAFMYAGYTLPEDEQEPWLQLLEHRDEERVRLGISTLRKLVVSKGAQHKPLLAQRLKRLEDRADDDSTRTAAHELLDLLHS